MVSLLESSDGFAVGSVRGWGNETRVRIGTSTGVSVGAFNFNAFGLGVDFFRYAGLPLDIVAGPTKVFVLVPNLDMRFYVGDNRLGAAIGTSLTGLRVANCALTGCFEVSLRVLTLDLWAVGDDKQASPAVTVGGSLSVGIKL